MKTITFANQFEIEENIKSGKKTMIRQILEEKEELDINKNYSNFIPYSLFRPNEILNAQFTNSSNNPFSVENKHLIQIDNIKIERLQNISDRDYLEEGIKFSESKKKYFYCEGIYAFVFDTPKEAFASLINKIYGEGTWENNPIVICYSFKNR